jgi:hypothetical protein
VLKYLRPTATEIERLALRETDYRHYPQFTPITPGFFLALGVLLAVAAAAVVISPFRLIIRVSYHAR